MATHWLLLTAVSIFIVYNLLLMRFGRRYYKKEYGEKNWNNWTSRLYNLQALIFYSLILTTLTLFILKWANVLDF